MEFSFKFQKTFKRVKVQISAQGIGANQETFCSDKFATQLKFTLDVESNPFFTAEAMVTLACAVTKLYKEKSYGAYSVFDVPLSYLSMLDRRELIKTLL